MLIYGASGYTGELVAREAVRRGLAPILAGRNAATIEPLARELALPFRAFPLDDGATIASAVRDCGAVLHCAGPFVRTSRPMVDACLTARVHSLDITGEIAVFESILRRGQEAKSAGVALLPGVGFDVVPTDCLARALHERLPDATHLDLAYVNQGGGFSRGTLATMIESLPHAGAMRVAGKLVPVPLAAETLELELPAGRRTVMSIPWGDVSTAFHTTGIPNVRVFSGVSPSRLRFLRRWRFLLPLAGLGPVKRALQRRVRRTVTGPDAAARRDGRVQIWGRARNAAGRSVTATFSTPEGYALTAITAVEALVRVASGELAPGAWTPAAAFGSGFIFGFEGVTPAVWSEGSAS
jgi:short subunit dehydrogenase-like uncharacterized protein